MSYSIHSSAAPATHSILSSCEITPLNNSNEMCALIDTLSTLVDKHLNTPFMLPEFDVGEYENTAMTTMMKNTVLPQIQEKLNDFKSNVANLKSTYIELVVTICSIPATKVWDITRELNEIKFNDFRKDVGYLKLVMMLVSDPYDSHDATLENEERMILRPIRSYMQPTDSQYERAARLFSILISWVKGLDREFIESDAFEVTMTQRALINGYIFKELLKQVL